MDSNLVRRVLFAAVAIPVALAVVFYGGWPLAAAVAFAGVLGTREVFDFARRQRIEPAQELGMLTVIVFAPVGYLALSALDRSWWILAFGFYAGAMWLLGIMIWALLRRAPGDRPLSAVAVTVFGVLYAGLLPAFLIVIRHSQDGLKSWRGAWLVFFPLVVTWVCDTAAMFGGKAMGGPKLAPTVSPGKTRSGTIAGIVAGMAVAPLFSRLALEPMGVVIPLWQLLLLAGVWTVIGQLGDLAESLFKREVGVKDSSALIPGHGGVLDRLDSLYFVVPTAALLYKLLGII